MNRFKLAIHISGKYGVADSDTNAVAEFAQLAQALLALTEFNTRKSEGYLWVPIDEKWMVGA